MSILDKAKAAAQKARKKADDLAKQLGYLIVRERSGGEQAGPQADELVAQIRNLEAQLAAEGGEPTAGDSTL
jgi:hypothetical protein